MPSPRQGKRLKRLWDRYLKNPVAPPPGRKGAVRLTRAQQYVIEKGGESAWTFLTSRDPETNKPLIWTKDEADEKDVVKPFPVHLDYVREYYKILDQEKTVLVDKARQMYITTSTMLYIHWYCLYRKARRVILSKSTEKEAKEIIRDKVRFVHQQMPLWAQAALPISKRPQRMIEYRNTNSVLIGSTQTVAETEARGGSASIVFVDEAARQMELGAIIGAVMPMAARLWLATTPDIGTPGAEEFKEMLEDDGTKEERDMEEATA